MDRKLNTSRWLDAYSEQISGLTTLPGNVVLSDINGDGNYCLVITDIKFENKGRSKMKVYKGTSITDIILPDTPNSLITFYTDQLEPRIPAVAVACCSSLFIHKNNKPYFKFQLPYSSVSTLEDECWKQVSETDNISDELINKVRKELSVIPYDTLSNKSQELLSISDKLKIESILRTYDSKNNFKESPITCMTTLKKKSDDKYEVSCPVLANEAGNIYILDPQTFTIIHQANACRTKVTPFIMRAVGIFNVEFRILVACREGYICLLRKGWLEGKFIIQMTCDIVDFVVIPDDNFIAVATTDKTLNCFTKRGHKLWSVKMSNAIICLCLVTLSHIRMNVIAVGLKNGAIQLYQGRKCVDQMSVPDSPSVLAFGQLGQEENVLVIITIVWKMDMNQEVLERHGSCLLLRSASQNSLDESSQKHISQIHPHTKERPPYKNHLHTQKAFDVMNVMRKQKLLCDVVLVANTVEVPAHKMVLASCSPYFYAMFSSFEESRQDRIVLQEVDHQALLLLIEYVYTSEVHVTEDNVQILLPAANLLQLTDVRDACCDFLQTQLHPTNCLGIRAFADLHGCLELLSHAEAYIELHFPEVVECEEFLTLSHQQVSKLICSDRLTVPSEEKVFECVIAWVQHDLEFRHKYLSSLMEHVRLPLMSQDYLVQHVEEEPLLKADLQCKDYLIEALKYHLLKGDSKTSFRTPRTKPRQPVGLPKVLLVVGGQAPKAIRSVETYDFKEERWYQLAEMPTRRCRAGLAVLGGKVFAVGGFNGSLRVKTVDIYDAATDIWTSGESMEARRSTLGVAVLNNCIYAVGGFDGSTGLNSAEMYDITTGKWRTICPMSTRRSSVGVGVLCGQLYAVGGYDGASRQCLSSVECYAAETDAWTPVPDMGSRRSGAGVGVLDGVLYAVGGHDGPLVRKSVEVYDPSKRQWRPVGDMSFCRRNAGVVAVGGLLYVVGGDDGSSNLASVEVYNPKTDSWAVLPSCMGVGRSYAGVAVVDKPM